MSVIHAVNRTPPLFIAKARKTVVGVCVAVLGIVSPAFAANVADTFTAKPVVVSEDSFKCITQMTKVRGFYVDNLLGHKRKTLAVAHSKKGGVYPPGSVVQLVPTEVMVKQPPGTNPATNDWEFFELDVSPQGSKILKRGYADVVNRFGGNCFGCHVQAKPEWDMVCEQGHGCQPIPLTAAMFGALQRSDPRCVPASPLSKEDEAALAELQAVLKNLKLPAATDAKAN